MKKLFRRSNTNNNFVVFTIIFIIGILMINFVNVNRPISVVEGARSSSRGNSPPLLYNGSVTPLVGNTTTYFTYQVIYQDYDNDTPVLRNVYIDGSPFAMNYLSGNFMTGATYQYSTTLSIGNHTYYFEFSDGSNTTYDPQWGNYTGPSVTSAGGSNSPPYLHSGWVTPYYGNTSTLFTYEVIYHDHDNDTPTLKKVYIDGIGHDMTLRSGIPLLDAIYEYKTTLPEGNHTYYFLFSDGHNHTVRYPSYYNFTGPIVNNSWPPSNPPTLTHGSVTPSSGNTSTLFTYQVTWKDLDNDSPITKYVYIDGSPHSMSYQSGNNIHGAIYQYQTTLGVGNHTYYFYFMDSNQSSARLPAYGAYYGPSVTLDPGGPYNHPPILSGGTVQPSSGNTSTTFVYHVHYTDYDNDLPVTKNVYIDGTPHVMSYLLGIHTQGALYQYSTKLTTGSHNYYFDFSDGNSSVRYPQYGVLYGPNVSSTPGGPQNYPPTLANGHVYPQTGTPNTTFTYRVHYQDPNNDPPVSKLVYIDNIPHTMNYIYGTYLHGAIYQYQTTLGLGNHNFYFYFTDGIASARDPATGTYPGPIVNTTGGPTNNPPRLSQGTVSPHYGTNTTLFTYQVIYTDLDYDPPTLKQVVIDGVPHTMTYKYGSFSTGAVYEYQTLLPIGNHTFYFQFSDGKATVRLPAYGVIQGPCVTTPGGWPNHPPILYYGFVTPFYGNTSTMFTYRVYYRDPENDPPVIRKVFIGAIGHTMNFVSGNNYTGAIYQYQTTLPLGNHTYYFSFNDGTSTTRLPASGSYSGPIVTTQPVNHMPVLSHGTVTPLFGTTSTMFTYQVYYKDLDNDPPTIMKVYIDSSPHVMSLISGSYTTGALYQFKTTLGVGVHNYYFYFSDGKVLVRLPVYGTYSGPTVTAPPNQPPVADAGPDQTIKVGPKRPVYFDGSGSYDLDNDTLTYFWDFRDGGYAIGVNVNHIFRGVGTYNVTLTVWDGQAIDKDYCLVHVIDSGKGKSKGKAPDKPIPGFEGFVPIIVIGSAILIIYWKRRRA